MGVFKFKQFVVEQGQTAMKVGTDGCLLGAWANHSSPNRILDIGTGTGVVALMLAQRFSEAVIQAVELEAAASKQARSNFEESPWKDRILLEHSSIQDFASREQFDLIVSNPPFFPEGDFSLAEGEARQMARSTGSLSYSELLAAAARLLAPQGRFQLILPANLQEGFSQLAKEVGLFAEQICWIQPLPDRQANRVLLSYSFNEKKTEEQQLIIRLSSQQKHHHSAEYVELLKDFLIIF